MIDNGSSPSTCQRLMLPGPIHARIDEEQSFVREEKNTEAMTPLLRGPRTASRRGGPPGLGSRRTHRRHVLKIRKQQRLLASGKDGKLTEGKNVHATFDTDEEEEELEDVPAKEKEADPQRHAKIIRYLNGTLIRGKVDDIEQGKNTKDRLYLIKYDDGDLEHYTRDMVIEYEDKALPTIFNFGINAPIMEPLFTFGHYH
jgi:hypothetical protein